MAKGATIKVGDLIGTVAADPQSKNLPRHLHIDAAGGTEVVDPTWLNPVTDPLALLDPSVIGDMIPPTMGDVHFMRGEDDNNFPHNLTGGSDTSPPSKYKVLQDESRRLDTHTYFDIKDFSDATIVGRLAPAHTGAPFPAESVGTENIEVLANATDKVKGDWDVGIHSIEFNAVGQFVGKTIPTVRSFNYVGPFVYDPLLPYGTQDYTALDLSDLTRVAYENDYRSPSNAAKSVGVVSYFHDLTNTDGGTVVDFTDRARNWRSRVTQGAAWNDITSGYAANNATGAFPDDYYTFTITAEDAAGNGAGKTSKVLLDNWEQQLVPVVASCAARS